MKYLVYACMITAALRGVSQTPVKIELIGKPCVAMYDYNTITGKGKTHITGKREDFTASSGPFFFLSDHQKYDLKNRAVIRDNARRAVTEDDGQ